MDVSFVDRPQFASPVWATRPADRTSGQRYSDGFGYLRAVVQLAAVQVGDDADAEPNAGRLEVLAGSILRDAPVERLNPV
jgi:hypothetical protein